MKKNSHVKPAITPFPVDFIRQFLVMNGPPVEEISTLKNTIADLQPSNDVKVMPSDNRDASGLGEASQTELQPSQRIRVKIIPKKLSPTNAFKAYDGTVDFDHWLNLPTTTRSQTTDVQKALCAVPPKSMRYLKEIGFPEEDSIRGNMAGKILAMVPVAVIRELYFNYANERYADEKEFLHDCSRILSFLGVKAMTHQFLPQLKDILAHCHSFYSLSDQLLSWRCNTIDPIEIRHFYVTKLRKLFEDEMMNFFTLHRHSTSFLSSFCIGFLSKAHVLHLNNVYWTPISCQKRMEQLCFFYQHQYAEDPVFVKKHFPHTIDLFLAKKEGLCEGLYKKYVLQKIYSASFDNKPLEKLMEDLKKYEAENNIEITLLHQPFEEIYKDLLYPKFNSSEVQYEPLLKIKVLE